MTGAMKGMGRMDGVLMINLTKCWHRVIRGVVTEVGARASKPGE
jgi:hypothetical protein